MNFLTPAGRTLAARFVTIWLFVIKKGSLESFDAGFWRVNKQPIHTKDVKEQAYRYSTWYIRTGTAVPVGAPTAVDIAHLVPSGSRLGLRQHRLRGVQGGRRPPCSGCVVVSPASVALVEPWPRQLDRKLDSYLTGYSTGSSTATRQTSTEHP